MKNCGIKDNPVRGSSLVEEGPPRAPACHRHAIPSTPHQRNAAERSVGLGQDRPRGHPGLAWRLLVCASLAYPALRAPGLAWRLLVCASLSYPALRAPGLARRLLVCASLPYPALRAPGLAWRLLVCASFAYPALRAPLPIEGETCHRMAGACHAARKEQVRRTSFPFFQI